MRQATNMQSRDIENLQRRTQELHDQNTQLNRVSEDLLMTRSQNDQLRNETANLCVEKKIWEVCAATMYSLNTSSRVCRLCKLVSWRRARLYRLNVFSYQTSSPTCRGCTTTWSSLARTTDVDSRARSPCWKIRRMSSRIHFVTSRCEQLSTIDSILECVMFLTATHNKSQQTF